MNREDAERELIDSIHRLLKKLELQEGGISFRLHSELFARELGFQIINEDLFNSDGDEGWYCPRSYCTDSKASIVMYRPQDRPEVRVNFTFFHEVCHHILEEEERFYIYFEDVIQIDVKIEKEIERLCNLGSAELLMPQDVFKYDCQSETPSLDLISKLSKKYNSSLESCAIRFVKLIDSPVAFIKSDGKTIQRVSPSKSFRALRLPINKGCQINISTQAGSAMFYKGEKRGQKIPVRLWAQNCQFQENAKLFEQSWDRNGYGEIFTLIWICDPLE